VIQNGVQEAEAILVGQIQNGVDHRHFVAEHSGHGLQNDNKAYLEYLDAVVEYLDKYMKD
jgi:hypothetical protein